MQYSLVIPTFNSAEDIYNLFSFIKENGIHNKAEIIVVDSGSKDNTIKQIKKYNCAKIINAGYVSKGKARNIGIKESKGDVIINIDSDVRILPGWFDALERSMKTEDIVAGYSPDPKGKQLPRVPIYIRGQDITYPCCNIAHKKEVFEEVGYYNEIQNLPEDIEFNYRCVQAGYNICYNSKMKLYHDQRTTWKGFCKQAFWNGEARYELKKIQPDLKSQHGASFKNLVRLGFGFFGYTIGRFYKKKGEKI